MVSETANAEGLPGPNDVLAGKYRVDRVLGAGGMGAVVAATHVGLGQRVAVKVMLPHLTGRADFTARFLREARAVVALRSEHVARVFDVGKLESGAPYMVMELLEGQDLEAILRGRGPLPIEEAAGYLIEACDALAEAHALGIVHRDLKPSNLFVARSPGREPIVKVLDFGISKATQLDRGAGDTATLTETEAILGSPLYMSPEQLRDSKGVDTRTDIWALGMILHKILTGKPAFEASTVGAHLAKIVTEPPLPLRSRRPEAPAALEAAILRCLERDLQHRFQNVAELARTLAPFAPPAARSLAGRIAEVAGVPPHTAVRPPDSSSKIDVTAATAHSLPAPIEPAAMERQSDPTTIALPAPASIRPRPVDGDGPTATSLTWGPGQERPKKAMGRGIFIVAGGVVVVTSGIVLGALRLLAGPATPDAPQASQAPVATAAAEQSATTVTSTGGAAESAAGKVSIWMAVEPIEAVVEVDGAPTRMNPLRLPRSDRTHTVVVRAPGHATETREVSARADGMLAVSLKKQGGRTAPNAPPSAAVPPPPPASAPARPGKKIHGPIEPDL